MRAVMLVDHGSRIAASNAQLPRLAELVQRQLPAEVLVGFAHMELAQPGIPTAIEALVARGATHLVVCPYFLGPGRHVSEDIPRLVNEAAQRHPGLRVSIAAALGVHSLLAELVLARAREAGLEAEVG